MPTIARQSLVIDYDSEGFPVGGPVRNGPGVLQTSWDELLWAAVTVGRPNRQYVFRHGLASIYEALFRWSLTRMALEQSGPTARRLRRTDAARTLDPSEKGAVNYFLGMTICKLFSAQLLQAPWVMHLDVFRPQINPVLRKRSRPDLVGQTVSNEWVVIESKGRISIPSADAKNKAKEQAEQLTMVNGIPPRFQIGGIAFFRNEVLRFFWRDPEPEPRNRRGTFDVKLGDDDWSYYFRPVLELIHSQPHYFEQMRREEILMPVNGLDINVGIHPLILSLLAEEKWSDARRLCYEKNKGLIDAGYQADGIRVVVGDTWLSPLVEFNKSR